MLGRKDFTVEERDAAKASVAQQLAAFRALDDAAALEPVFFNTAVLALDRRFVHRVRMVTGKDGTPLNELELIADSLMNNGGTFRDSTVIKYVPQASVVKFEVGDRIALTAEQFEQLASAVFAELDQKFA